LYSFRLKIVGPNGASRWEKISADLITLGQHHSNDVIISDPQASKHHAAIFQDEHGNYLIRDLSSRHRTWLNGRAIRLAPLQDHDEISLGSTTVVFNTKQEKPQSRIQSVDVIEPEVASSPTPIVFSPSGKTLQAKSRLQQLYEVATTINSTLECEAVLQRIMDQVCQVMTVERGFLALQDDPGGVLHFKVVRTPATHTEEPITVSDSIMRMAAMEGKAILIHDALDDPRFRNIKSVVRYLIRSVACVPLVFAGKILGVLYIDNRSKAGTFSQEDLQFLVSLGQLAAIAINNAQLHSEVAQREERLKIQLRRRHRLLACSPGMRQVLKKIRQVAITDVPVLITGESGTGKEVVAREIYYQSTRNSEPFVAVNCASIPESLSESELFGVCRGAATGVTERQGFFEQAQGGVLFLDEIGEMPIAQQAKLLRVLEEKHLARVGATRKCSCRDKGSGIDHTCIPLNVRIIAATNKDPGKEVREGRFRHDLYYRLNIFPLDLPPLRERPEDIPLLATFIFDEERQQLGKPVEEISYQAMKLLCASSWQGNNVRQLRSHIQRAIILSEGNILQPADFVMDLEGEGRPFNKTLREVAKQHILRVLHECRGNKTKAVAILGISAATLYNKLGEYGLDREEKSQKNGDLPSTI